MRWLYRGFKGTKLVIWCYMFILISTLHNLFYIVITGKSNKNLIENRIKKIDAAILRYEVDMLLMPL